MTNKFKELISQETIQKKIKELARQISIDYGEEGLLIIGILKGSWIFMADLVRELSIPVRVDFIGISSYGSRTVSSGIVKITSDLNENIKGKNVLVIEDIVDTGLTINYLLNNFLTRQPLSLKICTLLNKPDCRIVEVPLDYVGFDIPDKFVVGYGLDYSGEFRNLPYIAILNVVKNKIEKN